MLSKVKAVMLCLSLGLLIDVSQSYAETFQTSAPVALVEDVTVDRILMQKDADRPIAPASMTKIMTAYVIFDLEGSKNRCLMRLAGDFGLLTL
ncbi:D-alanyl-D-alanine carboxypeptidase family protein [Acetobacter senegalensis]|uniref:hypothetical protein n=1 Tax=Acetobacter senegalensis TaxID=446692 RepID=UPI001EDB45CF|nr:hypothetical protein [Acetobacter senegalensis]MCG4268583.1 hypothetical protein [Acetobacter senegalensis]